MPLKLAPALNRNVFESSLLPRVSLFCLDAAVCLKCPARRLGCRRWRPDQICPRPPNDQTVPKRWSLRTHGAMLGTYKPRSSAVSQVACLRHKSAAIRARRSSWNVRNTRRESTQPPRRASPQRSIHRSRTVPKSPGDRQGAAQEWPPPQPYSVSQSQVD